MNWNDFLTTVVQALLIPLITVLSGFLVGLLRKKTEEIEARTKTEAAWQAVHHAGEVVEQAVAHTTQTYVAALKSEGKFDADSMKTAFEMTKEKALKLITEESKEIIENLCGDLTLWLNTKIELAVKEQKSAV